MEDIQVNERLINFIIFLPLFFISLSVHEFAHAYYANKLGDSTAKDRGRLTLNPLKHIDLVGSVLMPLIAFASGFMIIGWAKPVPVNPNNFKEPYKDDAIVSVAGPISNFILALAFATILFLNQNFSAGANGWLNNILTLAVYFNIFLFAFNLLPIPPLDGSHILFDLFPNQITAKILNLGFYGTIILFLFIYSPLWKYFMMMVIGITEFILKFTA